MTTSNIRNMDSAPTDGTMIRLLVQFECHATEDTFGPAWTIGACSNGSLIDVEWQFAGWDWTNDRFTEGKGTPIGWLPLLDEVAPAPVIEPVSPIVGDLILTLIQSMQDALESNTAVPHTLPNNEPCSCSQCIFINKKTIALHQLYSLTQIMN